MTTQKSSAASFIDQIKAEYREVVKADPLFAGPGYNPTKYGNEVALNVGGGGPGKGRTVMGCGSQGTHGATNPGNPRPNPQHDALENE